MTYTLYTRRKTLLADMHTPVSVYSKLRDRYPYSLLLESADYHDRTDNKSIICLEPMAGFEARGRDYTIAYPDGTTQAHVAESHRGVFEAFSGFLRSFATADEPQGSLAAGLMGYTSFEAVQYMEDILLGDKDSALKDTPDLKYQLYRYTLIFDHFKKELELIHTKVGEQISNDEGIEGILRIIESNDTTSFSFTSLDDEKANMSDQAFRDIVSKGIQHCRRGDCFQVVLSMEFSQGFKGDDFTLYRSLRSISPSPYLFYFDYGDFRILGSSPESQLQVRDGRATINPIAGTAKRGMSNEEDQKLAEELSNNPKEKSEHVMLVDLARNDLSKHAAAVEVETYAEIQFFSQVLHMVSKVTGQLHEDVHGIDTYADTFPAGTLSGAPKYRALQIIAENEPSPRNFYGGAVGFIGFDGTLNHAIIIRSALSKKNTLVYQAGAGIVSGSTPQGELEEVHNKLKAIRLAIKKANTI